MNTQKPDDLISPAEPNEKVKPGEEQLQKASRRKLLRKASLIGLPAIATLASRPVLAWHCRTPSMWGSMVMNPSTSLRSNSGHSTGYRDETWTITNWGKNSARPVIFGGRTPWDHLLTTGVNFKPFLYAIKTVQPISYFVVLEKNALGTPTKYLDLSVFKISDLCVATSITLPIGVDSNATVTGLLEQNYLTFGAHLVVAQLNFKYLGNIAGTAYLNDCIGEGRMNLANVAKTGAFTPSNGGVWNQQRIISYLQNNWIVIPYEGYVTWYDETKDSVGYKTGTNSDKQEYNYFSFPNKIDNK